MTTDKKNTLTDYLKTHWFAYVLGITVIILIYFLLSGNKPIESHKTESDNLSKEYKELRDSMAEAKRRDFIQQKVIISQDSAIRSIRSNNEVTRKELDKTKIVAQRLAKEIKFTQPEDTSVYAHKVDSLVSKNQDLIELNDQYVTAVDSLNKIVDQQKSTYEQRINDQVALVNSMSKAATNCNTAYNGLNADYSKLGKQVRREKVKTKVAALIALAETAIIIFKK